MVKINQSLKIHYTCLLRQWFLTSVPQDCLGTLDVPREMLLNNENSVFSKVAEVVMVVKCMSVP